MSFKPDLTSDSSKSSNSSNSNSSNSSKNSGPKGIRTVESKAREAIPQKVEAKAGEQPKASKGWVASFLERAGNIVLGAPDENDKSIQDHQAKLATLLGSSKMNALIHDIAKSMFASAETKTGTKPGLFDSFINTEKQLVQDIIEVNMLHAIFNLATKLKKSKPDLDLSKADLFAEIPNMIAKEVNDELEKGCSAAELKKTEQGKVESVSKKIMLIAFPNGKADIIIPSSKKGWWEYLSGYLFGLFQGQLPKLILGFTEKFSATSEGHEKNLTMLKSLDQGDKLIELGKVLSRNLDRMVSSYISKEAGSTGEINKFIHQLSSYSEMIVMHILAKASANGSDKQHVLTNILKNLLSEVIDFSNTQDETLKKAFTAYYAELATLGDKYSKNSSDWKKGELEARKNINALLEPLTNTIKNQLGIDTEGLSQILPDQLSGVMWFLSKYVESVPAFVSKQLGGLISNHAFEFCRDVIYVQREEPDCKDQLLAYPESVKALDAIVNELMPALDLTLAEQGSSKIVESVNELIHGEFQVDEKLFENPIKEILASELMIPLDVFVQKYIRRTLVNLLGNLANSNPNKANMLSTAFLHLIKTIQGQVKNHDELVDKIISWKKEMALCESMGENTEAEKLAKAEKLNAVKLKKSELCALFSPCANEILRRGGWQDSQNILVPQRLKPAFKKFVGTRLTEFLFEVYSDTFALKPISEAEKSRLKHPERIEQFSQGIIKKAIPSIKGFLNEHSYLLAEKTNQKMAHSRLNEQEEAALGGQINAFITTDNYTTKTLWKGAESLLTKLMTSAVSRLSLAYHGADQGDALSNAIMQLRTIIDAQKMDPSLVDKVAQYKDQTRGIKKLDQMLAALKEKAVTEPNPNLFEEIRKISLARRKKFLELHIAEHANLQPGSPENDQMALVSHVLKAKKLIQELEELNTLPQIMQKSALFDSLVKYKALIADEYSELKTKLNLLETDLINATEGEQKAIKAKIADLQKRLSIKGKEIKKNELLKFDVQAVNQHLTVDVLLTAFKNWEEEKFLELEQTVPLQKQYQEILDQFKPLSHQLLQEMGFKDPKDLPVPSLLKPILWQNLEEAILPDMLLDIYRFAWVPSTEANNQNLDLAPQLDHLIEMVQGSSQLSSNKLKEILGKEDSSLPKLLAETLAEQGIKGMDRGWLKSWLEKLSKDQSPINAKLWSLIPQFLYNRIEFITAYLSKEGESDVNLLQHMFSKLFEPIAAYIKTNQKVIDEAIHAYALLSDNKKKEDKQKIANTLFGNLIDEVFSKSGLDQPHAYGIAYTGNTIISSLKSLLEKYCFDLCYDARSPQMNLAQSKETLNQLIAKENGIKLEEVNEISKVILEGFSALGLKIKDAVKTQIHGSDAGRSIIKALGVPVDEESTTAWYTEGVDGIVYHPAVKELVENLPDMVQAVILRKLVQLAQHTHGESPLKSLPVKIADVMLEGINNHRRILKKAVHAAYVKNPKISDQELQLELKKESLKIVDTLFKAIEVDTSKDLMPFTETLWSSFGKEFIADYITKTYLETTKVARSQMGNKLQVLLAQELKLSKQEAWTLRAQLNQAISGFGTKVEQIVLNKLGKTPDSDEGREFTLTTAKALGEKLGKGSPAKEKMTIWLSSMIDGIKSSDQVNQLLAEIPEMVREIVFKKIIDLSKSHTNVVLVILESLKKHRSELNEIVHNNPGLSGAELQKLLGKATAKIVDEIFASLNIKPKEDIPLPFADQLWENAGKGVVADMLAQMYLDMIKDEPYCRDRMLGYPETVKMVNSIVKELLPALDATLTDGGVLMKSINELLLGKFQADSKVFEKPIKGTFTPGVTNLMDTFGHDILSRTLIEILARLADTNPDFEQFEKVDMLAASLLHLVKICNEHTGDHDQLMDKLASWKKAMNQCEKMPESSRKEKAEKQERKSVLDLEKEKLVKLFSPAAQEIINSIGWNDPHNILMPKVLQPEVKEKALKIALPELLFRIYSDTFALASLTSEEKDKLIDHEKIDLFARQMMEKGMPSLKSFLDEQCYMFARKLNEKMTHSSLDIKEEAVIGSQLKNIFVSQNSTMNTVWAGAEKLLSDLVSLALSRLALAYKGLDQGDCLSNAIMQLRVLLEKQKIDPDLVDKIKIYRKRTAELKNLDDKLAKLREKAANSESSSEQDPSLFAEIAKLAQERRKKFLELHISEYKTNKQTSVDDKQMKLVRDLLKVKQLIQDVKNPNVDPQKHLDTYKALVQQESLELKRELSLLSPDSLEKKAKLERKISLLEKKFEENELLNSKILVTASSLLEALKKWKEDTILELEQTTPFQKQHLEILNQFKPLSCQLLSNVGFKNPKDLPAPFFLQESLWETLEDSILPDLCLEFYRFAWVPTEELLDKHQHIRENLDSQSSQLNELVLGSSQAGVQKLKELMEKKNSPLPKLLGEIFAEQGLSESWFKRWVEKLANDKHEMNSQFWSLVSEFLFNRIDNITANLVGDADSNVNLLQHMLVKIFEPIARHIKTNQAAIDTAICAYDSLPDNKKQEGKKKLARQMFGTLVDDILTKTGLDKPQAYGLAYLGNTIKDSLKNTLEGYCFDICHDARSPYIDLNKSKIALNQAIAEENGINPDDVEEISRKIEQGFSFLGVKIKETVETQLHDVKFGYDTAQAMITALGGSIDDDAIDWYSKGIEEMVYHPHVKELLTSLPGMVQAVISRKLAQLTQHNSKPGESPLKTLPVKITDAILEGINSHRDALKQVVDKACLKNPKISEKELQIELKEESLKVVDTLFKTIEIDPSKDLMLFTETLWNNFGKDIAADYFTKTYLETTKIFRSRNEATLEQIFANSLKLNKQEIDDLSTQLNQAIGTFGIKIEQLILDKLGKASNQTEEDSSVFIFNTAKMLGEKIGKGSPVKNKMTEWLASIVAGMTNSRQINRLLAEIPEMIHAVILKKLVDVSKSPQNVILILLDCLNTHRIELNQIVQNNPGLTDQELQKILTKATAKIVEELFKSLNIKPKEDTPLPFADQLWENAGKDIVADMLAQMYLDSTKAYRSSAADQLKNSIPDNQLRFHIRNGFKVLGGTIRDSAKIQLGLLPNKTENIGQDWHKAKPGEWVLRESKSKPGQFSLIQKQKGKTRKESPKVHLTDLTPEGKQQAIADYKNSSFVNTIGKKIIDKLNLDGTVVGKVTKWMTGPIKEVVNSIQVQQLMSDIPDIVENIVIKKMMQLAQLKGMPIQPKEGESPLKYLPANIIILILNGIEERREHLKHAVKEALNKNPTISDKELQVELQPEFMKMVEALFSQLKIDPQDDLPIPFANEIWNNVGKEAVADMFAKTYVDMSKNIREKYRHKANLDARFEEKKKVGHDHSRIVEATNGYTGFAMKYLKNMMVFNTPGLENALQAVDQMLRAQGDNETIYYLESNKEAIKKWMMKSNLKEIAHSNALGVEGTLFPAAKSDIRAAMLKIFDKFTGNIEKIEKKDPETTLNFVLNMMDLLTKHLQLVNEVTLKQGKSSVNKADPVLMEKEFAARGRLHPDMPGPQWRNAVIQTQKQIEALEKEVNLSSGEKKKAAELKLEAAKSSLKDLHAEAESKLKKGTYKKMASYFLQMAGYHGPEDLTEVPEAAQQMLWDALNNTLGPDLIHTAFGKAFSTDMLNGYMLKLLKVINEKMGSAFKNEPDKEEFTEVVITDPEKLTTEEIKMHQRQEKCRKLIEALTTVMPKSDLADLTKLDLINDLSASQAEAVLKDSLKEWSMLNIMEEALVNGAESLPKGKLPETTQEAHLAEVQSNREAAKVPNQIKQEAVLAVKNVRNTIWKYFKLKWKELQKTIDNWIAQHDIGGIFTGIKEVLDKIFHFIFFDIIGQAVVFVFSIPYHWIAYFYRRYVIQRDIENARKNIVIPPIHQNFGLEALDEFMHAFAPG